MLTRYITPGGLTVDLKRAGVADLGNGYTRYTATIDQINHTSQAISDTFLRLWFKNGRMVRPSFFTSQNVLPGENFSVTRNFQYDVPSSWEPISWVYGGLFFSDTPEPGSIEWNFPMPPSVSITRLPPPSSINEAYWLDAYGQSVYGDQSTLRYKWEFISKPVGSTATIYPNDEARTIQIFPIPETFTVRLTVTDSKGGKGVAVWQR
jgi:hypothetical protein